MADVLLLPSPRRLLHRTTSSSSSPRHSSPPTPSNTTPRPSNMETAIPQEPQALPIAHVQPPAVNGHHATENQVDNLIKKMNKMNKPILGIDFTRSGKPRHASSQLLKVGTKEDLLNEIDDSSATNLISTQCCGGNCCRLATASAPGTPITGSPPVFEFPNNDAFRSLHLKLSPLSSRSRLSSITPMPPKTIEIEPLKTEKKKESTVYTHPPEFVQPHPPHQVFSAPIAGSRELTRQGAPKRTYHFDLDVTDYPEEEEGVDFRVGGAIGVCAPNHFDTVDEIFDILGISEQERDEPILLKTQGGRWPTIWGKDEPRELETTRRELLTWTVDIQTDPPTKNILRIMAEYATDETEKTVLLYLCSKQGQAAFCELRTGPHITLLQLLNAFPSSKPPLEYIFSSRRALMPRFYSMSNDPHFTRKGHRRIIEIAVTVHESNEDWRPGVRGGIGSGFLERQARKIIDDKAEVRIPMFRGLMANPLAKQFLADGPMLLIGAGVGIAPFRGFVQRRLQNANCVNKVWVLQGVRDSLIDELYSGEWGVTDDKIKKVVQSRVGTGRYVQEEVAAQADLVWSIINSVDGRVFVCGSSKGMGEGVEEALVQVAMLKGRLRKDEAQEFWNKKKEGLQYIAETW